MASSNSTTSKHQKQQQVQYQSFQAYSVLPSQNVQFQPQLQTENSQESLAQNPTDPQKVLRYLLQDKTNNISVIQQQQQIQHQHYQTEQNTKRTEGNNGNMGFQEQLQQLRQQNIKQGSYTTNTTPQHHNQVSRSKSVLGLQQQSHQLDQTFPANYNQQSQNKTLLGGRNLNLDISRSMDLNLMSPPQQIFNQPLEDDAAKLIQSCLTFSGENIDDDMNFLNHAMQPDKIFDLPMALLKVQKAFQNSNQNALKLKESLEYVLQREQRLLDKYDQLKHQHQALVIAHEQESINIKSQFKEQLLQFSHSVTQLQNQLTEKDQALQKFKEQISQLQIRNQELENRLELKQDKMNQIEGINQNLQSQIQKKNREFGELRNQFDQLMRQEQHSEQEYEKMQQRWIKEEQRLKAIIEDKNLLNQVQQQELDCAREEKKIAEEQGEKMLIEVQKIRHTMKEDLEKRYIETLEQKKLKDKENEELKRQLSIKKDLIKDLERKYERAKQEQESLEEQLQEIKYDINGINENNRDALIKQRDIFEKRMKEMEDEVTKASLNRYKIELEQKQKFLKVTKKYDEQLRDLRQALGYVLSIVGVQDVPDFLKDELATTLSEVRIENRDIARVLEQFDSIVRVQNQKRGGVVDTSTNWQLQYEQLLQAYKNELFMRRGLHNQLQELKGSIRVLCRVRPMLQHETKNAKKRGAQIIRIANQHKLVVMNETNNKEQAFQYDRVFEQSSSQQDISEEVQQLVVSCLDGFNVCIMAYGQTGSGKTYTMIGDDENPGLYFSQVDEVFNKIHDRKKLIDYEVGVSIVEIYNETLRDLLPSKNNGHQAGQLIKLRDNGDGETLSDQTVKQVKSKNQVLQCLRQACMNRTVGMTHYNDQSSRSHFVFTLFVTGRHKETKDVFRGRLNLIDLAGSERILKSQAEGDRVKEALNINQSLTTLGKVFLALLNKASHVPYRDSKLTHYLKDSLGGDSKTMLIIQVSPSLNDYGETLSSLNFGSRVACIEKGQIRATIESPNKYVAPSMMNKRSKSQNKIIDLDAQGKSVTPQNKTFNGGYNSFNYN